MVKIFCTLFLALGVVACSDSNVKSEVKSLLIDPSSAEFRSITIFNNGNYCGEVNSKNRMGGYAGFKSFSKVDGKIEINNLQSLENLCEIAKDPVAYKCQSLQKDLKNLDKELVKENPLKGILANDILKDMKNKKEAEFTMLMCANLK